MKPVMNARECAEYLGMHPQTLKRKAAKGIIPGAKVGREWRFHKDQIDAWIKAGGIKEELRGQSRLRL